MWQVIQKLFKTGVNQIKSNRVLLPLITTKKNYRNAWLKIGWWSWSVFMLPLLLSRNEREKIELIDDFQPTRASCGETKVIVAGGGVVAFA